ncbi:endonuclease/exonuclease/phosphatase family protein [Rhizobium leguminosarum]
MKLRLGWWNTHLSPPGGRASPSAEHLAAANVALLHLTQTLAVDLVLLGEISPEDAEYLSSNEHDGDIQWLTFEGREGRLTFNFAVVFKPSQLELVSAEFEYDVIAGAKSKVALRLSAKLADGSLVTVFVIHWTSRLMENEETHRRSHLAQSLRRRVDQILDTDQKAKVVILGDFNDEPYDLSLSKYLLASRDVRRVAQRPHLLYNPFWKVLPPTGPYSGASMPTDIGGSYFHRSGLVHRWYVFDQIVFSSAFVGGSEWHLDEANTFVVDTNMGFPTNIGAGGHFDHYPVLASLERC